MKKKSILLFLILFLSFPLYGFAKIPGKYEVVGPQPNAGSLDVVEIKEVFSFTCPHCYEFNRQVSILKRRFGNKIRVVSYPIGWAGPNPSKLYYVAKAKGMGEDIKSFIFSAVFESGIQNINSVQILQFIANQFNLGKDFERMRETPQILEAVKKGQNYAKAKGIKSTPTIVVQDSYKMSGDIENISLVVNRLLKNPVKY